MIELTTGQPGSGKTLHTIVHVEERARKENRQVYYHGIKGLKLGWIKFDDPEKWYELPHGSIIVIDEAWEWFGRRHYSKQAPQHITELATHRHKGFDIYFITQGPHLFDDHIKPLVGIHRHIARKWGMEKTTIFTWQRVQEKPDVFQQGAQLDVWFFPRESFTWYHSAERHTHRRQIPTRIKMMMFAPLAIVGLGALAYQQLAGQYRDSDGGVIAQAATGAVKAVAPVVAPVVGSASSGGDYLTSRVARVEGLPHTAPRYDDVVGRAVVAPTPNICVATASRCQCYTEQGTKLSTPDEICRAIVRDGYFRDWEGKNAALSGAPRPPAAPPAQGLPKVVQGV